ncbi:hypothetical protein [Bacillus thuringiensis]|uniref:hypothetical protein n=1 Tax=Bacillus thuringiensis TaxID=1428 RepID=UPI0021D65CB9|nr:hypothetical protein [Bacillus thuringiensis]MCU7667270.1 hypothetical protein [Bacillus thuringiensis]
MSNRVYVCPTCSIRHTTGAWTYRTRYELGILNIDKEDIIPLTNKEEIEEINPYFFCPSCGSSNEALAILKKSKHIYNEGKTLEKMLTPLLTYGGSIIGLKSEKLNYISVDYYKEQKKIDVRYKENATTTVIEDFDNINDAIDYLLVLEVKIASMNNNSDIARRKRR